MTTTNSIPPRVIGLAGQKGHGKNLLGEVITRIDHAFETVAFADMVKRVASDIFGIPLDAFYDPKQKEAALRSVVPLDKFIEMMRRETKLAIVPRGLVAHTPRELLQYFGTDYVRSVAPNYWIETTMDYIRNSGRDTVVTDVRFENEATAVRRAGGLVARVFRDGRIDDVKHPSESILFLCDLSFNINTGDLNRVRDAAYGLLAMTNSPLPFRRPSIMRGLTTEL